MSERTICAIEAIYDELVRHYEAGDHAVTKTEDDHYRLLNDKGEEILEIWRGR